MHKLTVIAQRITPQYRRVFRSLSRLGACLLGLTACSSYQHQNLIEQGLVTHEAVASAPFQHAVFRPAIQRNGSVLHIYIEGDGLPWRTPKQISSNPTSPHSSMLHAMLRDQEPALLLGRPCYYDMADPLCNGKWWTSHRYNEAVVASMTTLVERLAEPNKELWLIGHSGGGTLAVLIAAHLKRPVTAVTLAANLDIEAWTEHHNYSPLFGSLNPLTSAERNPKMRELHWYGTADANVRPEWSARYCARWQASCIAYSGDHTDWLTQWPLLLKQSQQHFQPGHSNDQNSQRTPAE